MVATPDGRPLFSERFFSVIITNFNGLRFLDVCLAALRAQTYPQACTEVILVDDASSDGSAAFVRANYPEVRVIQSERNQGFIAGCHIGAGAARGEWLVMLNNDTEVEPGWLAGLASCAETNPQAGAIASKMLLFDRRDVLHNAGDLMGADGIPRNRGVWQQDHGQFDAATAVFGACGGGAAYRRVAWQQTGGFDRHFWMYLEDVDLAWRLRLLGWQAVFAPEARLYHHLSASGGGVMSSFYTGRNTLWMIAKNVPGPLLRRHFGRILRAQAQIAWDAVRAWRGEAARARLRGQLAGLISLPRVLAWRRATQATRRIPIEDLDRLMM